MKILGRHLIVEYTDCNTNMLNDQNYVEASLIEAVRKSGATIVESVFHRYNPQGVSGVIVIAESHLSIHTWPEYGYAAVDFFTCGQTVDPHVAQEHMATALEAGGVQVRELKRGMPSESDEIIGHKSLHSNPAAAPARG